MYNHTISVSNNQAFSKQYISLIYWMGGTLSGYTNYKTLFIQHKLTSVRKSILSTILKYCGIYQDVYMSQDKIAELSGCHHDTVLRTIKLFVEIGLLKKKYRGANRTCVYSLASFFHNARVQYALRDVFSNLYWSIKSAVRRCQSILGSLVKSVYKPITARLSNDKNKDINTIKKIKYSYQKPPEIKYNKTDDITVQRLQPTHNLFFNEFASILNLQGYSDNG